MSLRLDLTHQGLRRLPATVPTETEILDLGGNQISDLDEAILGLPRLRVLFLSGNPLPRLPRVLGRHPTLDVIGAKSCGLEEVPAEALPPRLRWLILTDNHLERLPPALGQRPFLEKVALAGNRLTHLPDLTACHRLALLRLGANPLADLPDWLADLPALAWLGFGGTPITATAEAQPRPLPSVPWSSLTLHEVLGQGASGIIHRATTAAGAAVAVKLFKGAITSDGWPRSELATWIAAGPHPHRVALLGRVTDHPQGSDGVVMPLVHAPYRRLGDPPSLSSCSRDTFPQGFAGPSPRIARIAASMARALEDLHARGLLHGDAYAHNLLEDGQGHALLGDFGAASFSPGPRWFAHETRAVACLIDDLLGQMTASDATAQELRKLAQACDHPIISQRPALATVVERLTALGAAGAESAG